MTCPWRCVWLTLPALVAGGCGPEGGDRRHLDDAPCQPVGLGPWDVRCVVSLARPAPVVVELERDDGHVRRFASDQASRDHGVLAWGLRAGTRYRYTVRHGLSDAVLSRAILETHAVPDTLVLPDVEARALGDHRVEALLVAPSCTPGAAILLDDGGQVIGMHDLAGALGLDEPRPLRALDLTPEGNLLALVGRRDIVEVTRSGQVVRHMTAGVHFDDPLHHDIARHEGLTWVLHAERFVDGDGIPYVLDGVTVFDGEEEVAKLSTAGWYTPYLNEIPGPGYWAGEFPRAHDFSHANALAFGPDGDLLLSFRHLSAIAAADARVGEPTFGALRWTLSTRPDGFVDSDFTIGPSDVDAAFEQQHDINATAEGTLVLFDNGEGSEVSRGLELAVDPRAGVVTAVAEFPHGANCQVHGGAVDLGEGHRLFTCPRVGSSHAYGPDGARTWTVEVSCGGAPTAYASAIPVSL